jgi:hypothetical protein
MFFQTLFQDTWGEMFGVDSNRVGETKCKETHAQRFPIIPSTKSSGLLYHENMYIINYGSY